MELNILTDTKGRYRNSGVLNSSVHGNHMSSIFMLNISVINILMHLKNSLDLTLYVVSELGKLVVISWMRRYK